jgi:hypothetical protein
VVTSTETPTPTPNPDDEKAQKEKEEKEKAKQAALSKAQNYRLAVGWPTAEAIDNWLARCNSPQISEALPGKSIGQTYLELGWKYGINPAYALAFFTKESSCGTAGSNLAAHDFGNIRWTPGYPTLDGVWRAYPSWTDGMEDWFKLLRENYLSRGATTLAGVLPIYAPESENDTTLYINEVMDWTDIIMAGSAASEVNLDYRWYCQATGFQVGWDFLDYWRAHGGVLTLGWPVRNQEYEGSQLVQYFERGVLEFHPENPPANWIMLRNLGRDAGKAQAAVAGIISPNIGAIYFADTGHWLSGKFAKFWQDGGGLSQFGYPIAEAEVRGHYLIQWFERARFELDLQAPGTGVSLGLVGQEAATRLELAKSILSYARLVAVGK